MTPKEINYAISQEANGILYTLGLRSILEKYGKVHPTGSYVLGLMTWRDLDIYIDNKDITEADFFRMGSDIAGVLKPGKMNYRNEFIRQTPGLPTGLYWGVYTDIIDRETWKIDIWALDSIQIACLMESLNKINSKLDGEKRESILDIKSQLCHHPEYRKSFKSVDIYDTVIGSGVRDIDEFKKWLQKNKGLVI